MQRAGPNSGPGGRNTTLAKVSAGAGTRRDRSPEEAVEARVGELGRTRQASVLLPSPPRAPALRRGRPQGAERRGRPWRTLEAAMASVVEYKGLKASYHCGYCGSEEGKVSCGECPNGQGWRGRRRPTLAPPAAPRTSPSPGSAQGRLPKLALTLPDVSSQTISLQGLFSSSPSPKMAVPVREGTEIAEAALGQDGAGGVNLRDSRRTRPAGARAASRAPRGLPGGAEHCGVAAAAAAAGLGWVASRLEGRGHGFLGRSFAQHRGVFRGRGLLPLRLLQE